MKSTVGKISISLPVDFLNLPPYKNRKNFQGRSVLKVRDKILKKINF